MYENFYDCFMLRSYYEIMKTTVRIIIISDTVKTVCDLWAFQSYICHKWIIYCFTTYHREPKESIDISDDFHLPHTVKPI